MNSTLDIQVFLKRCLTHRDDLFVVNALHLRKLPQIPKIKVLQDGTQTEKFNRQEHIFTWTTHINSKAR